MQGKVAVVTGAAGGIGKALVEKLLDQGAIVHAWDLNPFPLKQLSENASKYGHRLVTSRVDVTKADEIRLQLSEITKQGPAVSYWFNNAGVAGTGDFLERSQADFQRVVEINLMGLVLGTRIALEHMDHQGKGTIINMASVAGHVAAPFLSAYCATKFAVVGFTRALRAEMKLKGSEVQFVLVSPGFVETQMIAKGADHGFPEWLDWMLSSPESVASEVVREVARGKKEEIFPTLNGKVMLRVQQLMPRLSLEGSKMLLAKSFRDYLLNRYSTP